uniref:Uncharacterized protein n=1 Tax=Rhizophora mucronata TaxID=61149 RepID=A0A2P2NBA9_RHIMU
MNQRKSNRSFKYCTDRNQPKKHIRPFQTNKKKIQKRILD